MSKLRLATGFVLATLGLVAAVAIGSTLVPSSNSGIPAANTIEDASVADDAKAAADHDGTPDQGAGDVGGTRTNTTATPAATAPSDDHGRGRGRGRGRGGDDDD
jgi:hypothetical protein